MQPDELLSIMQFNAVANNAVLDAAAALSAEEFTREVSPSHKSVRGLLLHILGGDVFFLSACQDKMPDLSALEALEKLETLDVIRTCFAESAAEQAAFLRAASAEDLQRDTVISFGDNSFTLKMWQVILQQFSHGHMHRGELSIVMSGLGHPLPTIDLFKHFVIESGRDWPYD